MDMEHGQTRWIQTMCFAEASLEATVRTWHCGGWLTDLEWGMTDKSFDFQGRNGVQYVQEPNFKSRAWNEVRQYEFNVFCRRLEQAVDFHQIVQLPRKVQRELQLSCNEYWSLIFLFLNLTVKEDHKNVCSCCKALLQYCNKEILFNNQYACCLCAKSTIHVNNDYDVNIATRDRLLFYFWFMSAIYTIIYGAC